MAEHTTVFITGTTPGIGTRTYTESGKKYSMDVDGLTPNTEYRADAEYEDSAGVTIQTTQSVIFRTLPPGTFSISNPVWQNDNDGQHSTFTFNFTSTYALSYSQITDMATGVTYQGSVAGNTVTAQLPAGTAGTQHNFQLTVADIHGSDYTQGAVMTLQASMAETPFYIEAENPSDAPQITLSKVGSPTSLTMQISYDKSTWTNYTIGNSITLSEEHPRIYFKNSGQTRFSTGSSSYYRFTANNYVNVGGNIASLRNNTLAGTSSGANDFNHLFYGNIYLRNANKLYLGNYTTLANYCYNYMFRGCTALTTAPELPATTLATQCYSNMFYDCTSLTSAPTISATTVADKCCQSMFSGCTSLTTAPALPATTLATQCYNNMFYGCTSLTTAPALPATTLAQSCYSYMFWNCRSLTTAPALPATTLADSCYNNMFNGCTSLTQAPTTLPATILTDSCYSEMFNGCTSLTQAPTLPATTLALQCYGGMFSGCTSLTQAPELLATTLAQGCYQYMFGGCTSLTQAPMLPAVTLVDDCYRNMFYGCAALTSIICLAVNHSASGCTDTWVQGVAASGTFYKSPNVSWSTGSSGRPSGWNSMDYIIISNPNWQNDNDRQHSTFSFNYAPTSTLNSVQITDVNTGVTYQGTVSGDVVTAQLPVGTAKTQHKFRIVINDSQEYVYTHNVYVILEANASELPLYIELNNALSSGSISLGQTGSPTTLTMQISYDNSTWENYTISTTINLDRSQKRVYFRNSSSTRFSTGASSYYKFTLNGYVNVGGNIASLKSVDLSDVTSQRSDFNYLFANNTKLKDISNLILSNYTTLNISCYSNMFQGCTGLTSIPSGLLPATTLASSCYSSMFQGCTGLTSIPSRLSSANTLAYGCYQVMFKGCTGLTTLPDDLLPVNTLAESCYSEMFSGCTGLRAIPNRLLPATTLALNCYSNMFRGCTGLTSLPNELLPATTLAQSCYYYMFYGCTGLTTLPSRLLPATTLAQSCYCYMFYGCTGLTSIPSGLLPATTLAQSCYSDMFSGCTSLASLPSDLLPATTLASSCYARMFTDCSSITIAPMLPATTLTTSCYQAMFSRCASLKEITCLAENTTGTSNWVSGVASDGTFYKSPNMSSWTTGASGIPTNWTVLDYSN